MQRPTQLASSQAPPLAPSMQVVPAIQRSRPTFQVNHGVTSSLHQVPPSSSPAAPILEDSDSDAPLVPRSDLPRVKRYRRGSAAEADVIANDDQAMRRIVRAKVAKSSIGAARTRAEWWPSRAMARGIKPFPLTPNKVRLAAALLRQAGYRSAPGYLSGAKRRHVEMGFPWDDQLALEFKDCCRAVKRGIGPPKGAAPFQLDDVVGLTVERRAELQKSLVIQDPVNTVIVASWWMLREVELANIRRADVTIKSGPGPCGIAEILLPVDKTDVAGSGKQRAHCCACPAAACPVRALRALLSCPDRGQGYLVAQQHGPPLTKQMVVASFRGVAVACGQQDPHTITGHSGRVTGAQRMARSGLSEWRIQAFGRWGSNAVLRYIRSALLEGNLVGIAPLVEAAAQHPADTVDAVRARLVVASAPPTPTGGKFFL